MNDLNEPNIDRNDPRYKKAKRTIQRLLASLNFAAILTNDELDDELAAMISEDVMKNFDRYWEVKYPRR